MASLLLGRLGAYFACSLAAAVAVAARALDGRSNFYAAMVALARSHGAVVVFGNLGIVQAMLAARAGHRLFFGRLRQVEEDRMTERLWYSVMESLVAAAIFHKEFDLIFAVLFGFVLFLKTFHWLVEDRIEYMEQVDALPTLFHVRIVSVQCVLFVADAGLLLLLTGRVKASSFERLCMLAMYACDVSVLLATLVANAGKYVLNLLERRWGVWERKGTYLFFIDLLLDSIKMAVYINFLTLTLPRIPLYLVRDIYLTARSIVLKIRDTARYRAATRNMDGRYPTATAEELEDMSDGICIICRENLNPVDEGQNSIGPDGLNYTPKKLPCGHIFHFHCLRAWLERQQSCPTCRRTVFQNGPQTRETGGDIRPAPNPAPAPDATPAPAAAASPVPTPVRDAASPVAAPEPAGVPTPETTLARGEATDEAHAAPPSNPPSYMRDREDMRRLLDEYFPVPTTNTEVGWTRVSTLLPPQYGPAIRLPTERGALQPTRFPTSSGVVRADELPPISTSISNSHPTHPVAHERNTSGDGIPQAQDVEMEEECTAPNLQRERGSDEDEEGTDPREMARRAALLRAENQRPRSGDSAPRQDSAAKGSAGPSQSGVTTTSSPIRPDHSLDPPAEHLPVIIRAENELMEVGEEVGEDETEYIRILRSYILAEERAKDLRRLLAKVEQGVPADVRQRARQAAGLEPDEPLNPLFD